MSVRAPGNLAKAFATLGKSPNVAAFRLATAASELAVERVAKTSLTVETPLPNIALAYALEASRYLWMSWCIRIAANS